jgi:periplasmic copper chaperone A
MRSDLWRAACCAVVWSLSGALCAAGAAATVVVNDAWIRWLPASLPAGGYAIVHNAGTRPVILLSVSSPDYGEVSLHRSSIQQGNSVMQSVAQITIPAHGSLNFATAGYHIMLQQPTRPLQPGDHVPIALRFADGSSMTVVFDVRRPDAGPLNP